MLAEPAGGEGVGVVAGMDSAGGEAAGVAAAGGVEAGVAGAGVEVGVAAGLGGSGDAGGGDGLHEERRATAAASAREDALFIGKEASLRMSLNSKLVQIYIFQFTASDRKVIVCV